jgi:hypothetical protein
MANFSLRGIDDETALRLRSEARRRGLSVNALIVELIRQGLGFASGKARSAIYRDLDALAGTWGAEETARFPHAVSDFERIDEGMWGETNSPGHQRRVQARRGGSGGDSAPRRSNRAKQHRAGWVIERLCVRAERGGEPPGAQRVSRISARYDDTDRSRHEFYAKSNLRVRRKGNRFPRTICGSRPARFSMEWRYSATTDILAKCLV